MNCILLAAGYATRLRPLTLNKPKALLTIANKSLLSYILEKIQEVPVIDSIVLVSNHLFIDQFQNYFASQSLIKNFTIIDNGTETNDSRLGALADLQLAITQTKIQDDILVLAADNLFDFSLMDFVEFALSVGTDCITAHHLPDKEALKRTGVAELDEAGRVLAFEEKPAVPKSSWAVPPFYFYKTATFTLLQEYLDSGANPDAPGNFIPWLLLKRPVFAYRFQGQRYDIGTVESYNQANKIFSRKLNMADYSDHLPTD